MEGLALLSIAILLVVRLRHVVFLSLSRSVDADDDKGQARRMLECCASCQAKNLNRILNVLSNNDPNENARATYWNCANKYHDILYQNLAPAYLDLWLGRFGDTKSELQTALLIHNQCLYLLKNMKYPTILGIISKQYQANS